MSCYKCVKEKYCPYIHYFNLDKNIGCIEFRDKDNTTHTTNTLNEEIDCKYDLATTRHIYSSKLYLSNDIKSIVYKDKEYDLKVLEAFDIIKKKMVIPTYIVNTKNAEEYNKWLKEITLKKDWFKRKITQEEYDLLKEVLL